MVLLQGSAQGLRGSGGLFWAGFSSSGSSVFEVLSNSGSEVLVWALTS